MADLDRANSQGSQSIDGDDLLTILNREAQEAIRRVADQLNLPQLPRSGPERSAKYRLVCQAYAARRERKQFFEADLFGEPVWDLLLFMYREHLGGRESLICEAIHATDLPRSTAARWMKVMEQHGLIIREGDGDMAVIKLTDGALNKLEAYMEDLRTKSLMRVI